MVFLAAVAIVPANAQHVVPLPAELDKEKAEAAAEDGDVVAIYIMGAMNFAGRIVPRDYQAAAAWFEKAAFRRFVLAQFNLAEMYDEGKSLPQNDERAYLFYSMAARHGLPEASYMAGRMLAVGRGVAKDGSQALLAFRDAARQGHVDAQNLLGRLSEKGTSPNLTEAYKWYTIATAGGSRDAEANRSSLRAYLTAAQIASAQRQAATFTPTVRLDLNELKRDVLEKAALLQ